MSALARRVATLWNTEAGGRGGGGAWWGRLGRRYWEAVSRYDWNEAGKVIYRDCRCEAASVRLSLISERATLREWDGYDLSWGWLCVLLVERDFLSSSESFQVFRLFVVERARSNQYSNNFCQHSSLSRRENSNEKHFIGNFQDKNLLSWFYIIKYIQLTSYSTVQWS